MLLSWSGRATPYLDRPHVVTVGPVAIGRHGGSTSSGADRNEDAAWIWCEPRWTMAAVLDAHAGHDSAETCLDLLTHCRPAFADILGSEGARGVRTVQAELLGALTRPESVAAFRAGRGETSLLVALTVEEVLWWFNVGDCVGVGVHPQTARLGGGVFTSRQFFQWVGRVDALQLDPPSWSSGVQRLRSGTTRVGLLTDGPVEAADSPLANATGLLDAFSGDTPLERVQQVLSIAVNAAARDSSTVVTWDWPVVGDDPMPSG